MSWLALLVVACVRDPADRWLEDVARGNDADAWSRLEIVEPPPGGFDVARFAKRVDRIGLRRARDVRWTRRTRAGFQVQLEGTAVVDDRTVPLELRVGGGQIRDVVLDEVPLVPVRRYVVVPDDRAVDELRIPDLWARPGRYGLEVGGTTDAGTLTVNARCLVDDAWVANAMVGAVNGPFVLTVAVPVGSPCQLGLRLSDQRQLREAVACWTGQVTPGACAPAPAPDPSGPPVVVSGIGARWSEGGISVDYRLRANVAQPKPGAFESAVVTTTVACPDGKRPVTHSRPVDADWLEPGVDRVLGSPMLVHAAGRPCDLSLDYVRDDHYDRVELPLFEGCVDADGTVRAEPCG